MQLVKQCCQRLSAFLSGWGFPIPTPEALEKYERPEPLSIKFPPMVVFPVIFAVEERTAAPVTPSVDKRFVVPVTSRVEENVAEPVTARAAFNAVAPVTVIVPFTSSVAPGFVFQFLHSHRCRTLLNFPKYIDLSISTNNLRFPNLRRNLLFRYSFLQWYTQFRIGRGRSKSGYR